MRHHDFTGSNGGGSACSRRAGHRALLRAGSTRQLLVHEHYRSRLPDHYSADRSQGDGSLECRIFPRIAVGRRVGPKCVQREHRHGAFDHRSVRCLGFLDLFLPVLQTLESCAFASDLRDPPHPREPGSILPRGRLLGIALSYGVARIHLLEHHRGSHGESLGGYARAGYVRDANFGIACAAFPLVRSAFQTGWRGLLKPRKWFRENQAAVGLTFVAACGGLVFLVLCQLRWGHWDLYMLTQAAGWGIVPGYLAVFSPESYRWLVPVLAS